MFFCCFFSFVTAVRAVRRCLQTFLPIICEYIRLVETLHFRLSFHFRSSYLLIFGFYEFANGLFVVVLRTSQTTLVLLPAQLPTL